MFSINGTYKLLPIDARRDEIIAAVKTHQVTIIAGETGSGKTTHLPLLCVQAGRGSSGRKIVCTQPRRIAAVSLARYVKKLIPDAPENYVASKVRFNDEVDNRTRIAFVTDGILLSEIHSDPMLSGYDTIIIDEAHERTLNIDFLLGYLRILLNKRKDLKLIISSATIDTGLFSRSFGNAPVIHVSERLHQVELRYNPVIALWDGSAMRSHIDGVLFTVRELITAGESGDILIFLPTIDDINEIVSVLKAFRKGTDDLVIPLHSRISPEEQDGIFDTCKGRRIIVATNIAETSITVPGIRFVIDTGLVRTVRYDPDAGINRMPVERISQASAQQRAGRCGRVGNGICIRLYSEQDFNSRPRFSTPEIKRVNLAGVILRMAHLKIGRPENFPFIQRPSHASFTAAYRQLRDLDAIDRKGFPTQLGRKMAVLPLDPAISRMLLSAKKIGGFREMLIIAAALSVGDPRLCNTGAVSSTGSARLSASDPNSDFVHLVNIWKRFRRIGKNDQLKSLQEICGKLSLSFQRVREWIDVRNQLSLKTRMLRDRSGQFTPAPYETIHKNLLIALSSNLAELQSNGLYRTAHKHDIMISPGSSLFKKEYSLALFHEIVETSRLFGRTAAAIKPEWIMELFPRRCVTTYDDPHFDIEQGIVTASAQITFNGLTIVKNRRVDYSKTCPADSHEVFIREALIEGKIGTEYSFIRRNQEILSSIDLAERKLRDRSYFLGLNELENFYDEQLGGISTKHELDTVLKNAPNDFLVVNIDRLLSRPFPEELSKYPDDIILGDSRLPLSYVFDPDDQKDGVSVKVPLTLFKSVPLFYWEWLFPVFHPQRLQSLFEKSGIRIDPVDIRTILEKLRPVPVPFLIELQRVVESVLGLNVDFSCIDNFPPYQWLAVNITDEKGIVVESIRPPFQKSSIKPEPRMQRSFWAPYFSHLEKENIRDWDFDSPMQIITVGSAKQPAALPVINALTSEGDRAVFKIFFSETAARSAYRNGLKILLEKQIEEDLAWALKDIKIPESLLRRTRSVMTRYELESFTEFLFREIVLELPAILPHDKASFHGLIKNSRAKLPETAFEAFNLIDSITAEFISSREYLMKLSSRFVNDTDLRDKLESDLQTYYDTLFSPENRLTFIKQLPRILKAFKYRVETAFRNRNAYYRIYEEINGLRNWFQKTKSTPTAQLPETISLIDEYELLMEEYAMSLYSESRSFNNNTHSALILTKLTSLRDNLEVRILTS